MDIEKIKQEALNLVEQSKSSKELEDIRVRFLGRKGELTSLLRELGNLSPEERKSAGANLNSAKEEIEKYKTIRLEQVWVRPEQPETTSIKEDEK